MPRKILDAHCHGFPNPLMDAIWKYFEHNYWSITRPLYASDMGSYLKSEGVDYYTVLNYAHKPGISHDLNTWSANFASSHPEAIVFGAIHPGDPYLEEELDRLLSPSQLGLRGIKMQLMVTDFYPSDPRLDIVYEKLIQYNKILVLHAGNGPTPDQIKNTSLKMVPYVGVAGMGRVMERFPTLKIQIPHLGAMESLAFFDLAREYPHMVFDTAMALEFILDPTLFPALNPSDAFGKRQNEGIFLDMLEELQDRILFGSDFPNIPYPYGRTIAAIESLPFAEPLKEKIFYRNAARFYKLE